MGRTVATYRIVLEALINDMQGFRKALRKEDQVDPLNRLRLNRASFRI